jgi:hypothetical protein
LAQIFGRVIVNQAGSNPGQTASGFELSPARGSFLKKANAENVDKLVLTRAWDTGTWTWSFLGNAGSPPPAPGNQGVDNRFRVANYGDREVALICNSVTAPVYAFRTR